MSKRLNPTRSLLHCFLVPRLISVFTGRVREHLRMAGDLDLFDLDGRLEQFLEYLETKSVCVDHRRCISTESNGESMTGANWSWQRWKRTERFWTIFRLSWPHQEGNRHGTPRIKLVMVPRVHKSVSKCGSTDQWARDCSKMDDGSSNPKKRKSGAYAYGAWTCNILDNSRFEKCSNHLDDSMCLD